MKDVSEDQVYITLDRMKMKTSAAERGITLYQMGINKFIGNSVIKRLEGMEFKSDTDILARLKPESDKGTGDWIDMSGLIAPLSTIEGIAVINREAVN